MAASRAVVLGGGGVSGMAWMVGVLAAWEEGGFTVSQAQRTVGTSAGSAAAVLLKREKGIREAYFAMTTAGKESFEAVPEISFSAFGELVGRLAKDAAGRQEFLAGLFDAAHDCSSDLDARRRSITGRIGTDTWPAGSLRIVAAANREMARKVFTERGTVSVVDAVLASSAVPGVWPVVRIDGDELVDGGVLSATHCDLAGDSERVIILRPTGNLMGHVVPAEEPVLARAFVVEPDERSRARFGSNAFDPSFRKPSAEAGYRQGAEMLAAARQYWERAGEEK